MPAGYHGMKLTNKRLKILGFHIKDMHLSLNFSFHEMQEHQKSCVK